MTGGRRAGDPLCNFIEHIFSWKSDSCIGGHKPSRLLWDILITMDT